MSSPIKVPEPTKLDGARLSSDSSLDGLPHGTAAAPLAKSEAALEAPVPPPAEVGFMPWLQVLGGFFLMFNSWGILLSWGTFQAYYTSGGLPSLQSTSPSTIAWIGSVQAFLLLFVGALSGPLIDAGYFRPIMYLGAFLVVFGMLMTSLATEYWHLMLAQGLTVGLGIAMFGIVSLTIPASWFDRRRGRAIGFVTTGTCLSGILFPIMLHELIPRIGFGWAVRILAFVSLATLAVPLSVLRPRLPPRPRMVLFEYTALRQPEFALYVAGYVVGFLGYFMMYGFVSKWAIDESINTEGLSVFYILSVMNAAGVFGRLLPNLISDYVGALNVTVPVVTLAGVMVLVWLSVHSIAPLMVMVILYGFFTGAIAAMPAPSIASMTTDLSRLGGRIGVAFIAISFSALVGNPITGAIIQSQNGRYEGAIIFSGVMLLTGAVLITIARLVKTNGRLIIKA